MSLLFLLFNCLIASSLAVLNVGQEGITIFSNPYSAEVAHPLFSPFLNLYATQLLAGNHQRHAMQQGIGLLLLFFYITRFKSFLTYRNCLGALPLESPYLKRSQENLRLGISSLLTALLLNRTIATIKGKCFFQNNLNVYFY